MKVPYLDLQAAHLPRRQALMAAIGEVVDEGAFAGGPSVERFERAFASYCGANYAVGVGSGTDALQLALLACGVGPGDEVVTAPNSFFATAEAVSLCGAKPVFCDVDPDTLTLDPARLEAALSPRTKAVVPVHLFGQTADMDPILEIARRRRLRVVEDAAQAAGAAYRGRPAGSMGDAACFSFYPGKNLGAFGEAGAVATRSPAIDEQVRCLRDHGQTAKHRHARVGLNARMDGIQAAVLSVKLRDLDAGNEARRRVARRYAELLGDLPGLVLPRAAPDRLHAYHIFAVRSPQRDRLARRLEAAGVGHAIHYPTPIHLQPAYAALGYGRGDFPVAESACQSLLSLPIYPQLEAAQIDYVAAALEAALAAERGGGRRAG